MTHQECDSDDQKTLPVKFIRGYEVPIISRSREAAKGISSAAIGMAFGETPDEAFKIARIMAAAEDMQNALLKLREAIEEGDPHAIAEALIRYGIPAIEKSQGGGDD